MSLNLSFILIRSLRRLHCLLDRSNQPGALRVARDIPNSKKNPISLQGRIVVALLAACLVTGVASAQVTISSPASGSTVSSPVHVAASAKSSYPITAIRIYLDNVSVFLAYAAQISTNISASPGSHLLVVQAWDSSGAVFKTPT